MTSLKCPYCGWLCYPESYTEDTYDEQLDGAPDEEETVEEEE